MTSQQTSSSTSQDLLAGQRDAVAEVWALIQRAQRLLLVAHINPDGDTIGSTLGLAWALRGLGQECTVACPGPMPAYLGFLPGYADFRRDVSGHYDLILGIDFSSPDRMGAVYQPAVFANTPLVNIDHHLTNTRFGTINIVETATASTAEIVFALLRARGLPITPTIALCLLTGLFTDTQGFRTPSTTPQSLRVATQLLEAGASLTTMVEAVYNRKSPQILRLWGQALSDFRSSPSPVGNVVWASVTQAMLRSNNVAEDEVQGLVSFLRGTAGTAVAILFVESKEGKVKVEFRSAPAVDVSGIAFSLGGGGHRNASGCTLPGPLAAAEERVLAVVREELGRQTAGAQADKRGHDSRTILLQQAGVLADDDTLPELRAAIYAARGRAEAEEGAGS
jgi:phosphoesterase RecJ-like protein